MQLHLLSCLVKNVTERSLHRTVTVNGYCTLQEWKENPDMAYRNVNSYRTSHWLLDALPGTLYPSLADAVFL